MGTSAKIHKNLSGKDDDQTLYRNMIESLLCLTARKLDIAFAVKKCARFQSCPHESHLLVVKRVIKYVIGTTDFWLQYAYDTNTNLFGYSDADWARCDESILYYIFYHILSYNLLVFWLNFLYFNYYGHKLIK